MNTLNNKRSENTKKRIESVFIKLLSVKSINQISVQEICDNAKISRSSFYLHYYNIYDLMQKINEGKSEAVLDIFREKGTENFAPLNSKTLNKLFNHVRKNKDFYRVVLNDFNNLKTLEEALATRNATTSKFGYDKNFQFNLWKNDYHIEYMIMGLIAVIKKWINNDCKQSKEELINFLLDEIKLK